MKRRHLVAVMLTAAAIYTGWKLFGGGAEEKIRQSLDQMAELASKPESEGQAATLLRLTRLVDHFTAECEAADGKTGQVVEGREEIVRRVAWVRDLEDALTVEWEQVEVVVDDTGTATSRGVVRLSTPKGPSEHDGALITCAWVRDAGSWRVASIFVERD